MLPLHTVESRKEHECGRSGCWFELAPGSYSGHYWNWDSALFWMDDWERVGEPLLGERLPGYDRYGLSTVLEPDWEGPLLHLEDVCRRLESVEEPPEMDVFASDLEPRLRQVLKKDFPVSRDRLVQDLRALIDWCRTALKRWHAITVIGW